METNRKHEREWGVYDKEQNQFYNMDCTSILDDQHNNDTPTKGYSYEEAQRFIVHCDNKKFCKIVNIKQPKYLLNFELMIYRKEQEAENAKNTMNFVNKSNNLQKENNRLSQNKESYFKAIGKHHAESKKPMDGVQAQQLNEQKPKLEDFNLTSENFDTTEKNRVLRLYGIRI